MNAGAADRRIMIFGGLAMLLAFAFFRHPLTYDNINSRMNLTYAILRDRSASIDPYAGNTVDKALHDGHFYCDKAPGLPAAALAPAAAAAALSKESDAPPARPWLNLLPWTSLFSVSLPFCLAMMALAMAIRRWIGSAAAAMCAVFSVAIGTILLPYAGLYYEHAWSAALGAALFALLLFMRMGTVGQTPALLTSAGMLAGWMCASEYIQGATAVILVLYGICGLKNKRNAGWIAAGAAPAIAFFLAYNFIAFGSPFRIGYHMEAVEKFQAMESGLGGVGLPRPSVLWKLLAGNARGLLIASPVLIFAIAGFFTGAREKKWRPELMAAAAIVGVRLIANAGYYAPYGGFAPGPRHMASALPFLALPLAVWLKQGSPTKRGLAIGAAVFSCTVSIIVTAADPHIPEAFDAPASFALALIREGVFSETLPGALFGWPPEAALGVAGVILIALALALPPPAKMSASRISRKGFYAGATLCAALYWLASAVQPAGDAGARHYYLGAVLAQRNRPLRAAAYLTQAIKESPDRPDARYMRGVAYQKSGRFDEAEEDFRAAMRLNPEWPQPRISLAANLLARSRREAAAFEISSALALFPGHPALLELQRMLNAGGRP